MTREEVIKLLGENATEEQIKGILDKFHEKDGELRNKITEVTNMTNELNEAKTNLANIQSQLDEINKSKMTEQEKIEANRKEAEKYLADSKKVLAKAKVTEKLASIGINDEDLINSMVSDDIDTSINRADLYVNSFNTLKENTIKETTESLAKIDLKPTPSNNNSSTGMTWEKFTQLSDVEQDAFQREHPNEFDNLQ